MRLMWRIYIYFVASALLALAATATYANHFLRCFYQDQVATLLLSRAKVLASEFDTPALDKGAEQIDQRCKKFGRVTQTQVTIILPDGTVIGESSHNPPNIEHRGNCPEVAKALSQGRPAKAILISNITRETFMCLAVPVRRDGVIVAVVQLSIPMAVMEWTMRSAYRDIAICGLIVMVCFAIAAFCVARRISRPLEDMQQTAERLARGDLQARVAVPKVAEMASLARTLNHMATQLGERMETIARQTDELKAFFSGMLEGVLTVDGEGRVMDLNLSAAKLLGLAPDQIRGRSIQETVKNPDLLKFITACLTADGPEEAETAFCINEERALQLHGTALTDYTGKNFRALIVLNDITEYKRTEEELRFRNVVLSTQQETSLDGILVVGEHSTIVSSNRRFAEMWGIPPDIITSLSDDQALQLVVDKLANPEEFISKVKHLYRTRYESSRDEIGIKDGRTFDRYSAPMFGADGKYYGRVWYFRDITNVKRLETIRQEFVANVSHELKTPITALRGCVETLSDPTLQSPEDDKRFRDMMGRQVARLSTIIEELLSLSRIEHDTEHKLVPLESGPINDVLRRVVQAFSKEAAAKSIGVSMECPNDLTAPINAAMLEQAVGNLVDNAIKYSGERARIAVTAKLQGDFVEIRVADNGPGIDKKHLSRIFERFYRIDQARSRALGGTGLGLAIVKHIALAHGGSVSVESTPGQGSAFTILIPT